MSRLLAALVLLAVGAWLGRAAVEQLVGGAILGAVAAVVGVPIVLGVLCGLWRAAWVVPLAVVMVALGAAYVMAGLTGAGLVAASLVLRLLWEIWATRPGAASSTQPPKILDT